MKYIYIYIEREREREWERKRERSEYVDLGIKHNMYSSIEKGEIEEKGEK